MVKKYNLHKYILLRLYNVFRGYLLKFFGSSRAISDESNTFINVNYLYMCCTP